MYVSKDIECIHASTSIVSHELYSLVLREKVQCYVERMRKKETQGLTATTSIMTVDEAVLEGSSLGFYAWWSDFEHIIIFNVSYYKERKYPDNEK